MGMKGTIANLQQSYDNWNALLGQSHAQTQANYQPYLNTGTWALNALADPQANFQASPDYQWRLNQGQAAVTQNKAVNGLLKSGSALKALNNYGQQAASQEYGDWWQRQAGLAGAGMQAIGAVSDTGYNNANAQGGNMVNKYLGTAQLKQQAQAQTNSLWGGLLGTAAGLATSNPFMMLGGLGKVANSGGGGSTFVSTR